MATPNYSYEKRQRELAKKRKAEEKRMRKLSGKADSSDENTGNDVAPSEEAGSPPSAATPPRQD